MQTDARAPFLPRRAILTGLGGVGLSAVLNACGGSKGSPPVDSAFATNAARNALSTTGSAPTTGSATTGTPAATGSQTASTPSISTTASGSSVATVGGSAIGTTAAVTATVTTGSGGATPTVAANGPTPTHITGAGPLPKPLPTQGGTPPTVVGAPTRAATAAASTPSASATPGPAASISPGSVPSSNPVASATPAPAAKVTITAARAFDPPQVTINKGEAVQWVNAGRSPQTVTDDPARAADKKNALLPAGAQPWDSGVVGGGAQYTKVFDVPGDYVYFSIPAEGQGLVGRITVKG